MFAGVNMFLARLRPIFYMSSEEGQKHTPKNIKSVTIIIISEGVHKRNQRQRSQQYLERCRRRDSVYSTITYFGTKAFVVA